MPVAALRAAVDLGSARPGVMHDETSAAWACAWTRAVDALLLGQGYPVAPACKKDYTLAAVRDSQPN